MKTVTESIWSNDNVIIPMSEVSHIEKVKPVNDTTDRITIIFKHSKWNQESQYFEPNVYLDNYSKSREFISAWCRYRSELESETLMDLTK